MDHCSAASRRSVADVSIIRGSAHRTESAHECGAQDRRCRRRTGGGRGGAGGPAAGGHPRRRLSQRPRAGGRRENRPGGGRGPRGTGMPNDGPIGGRKGVSGSGVRLTLGTPVKAIDRGAHAVITDTGERIGYDALVLATGSINRELPMFPAGRNGIYYLRTEAEARALKARLHQGGSLLVIGGGPIGLEVAAAAPGARGQTTRGAVAPRRPARRVHT